MGPFRQQGRAAATALLARNPDQLIEAGPREAQTHSPDALGQGRKAGKAEQRPIRRRRDQKPGGMALRHEQVPDLERGAAGAAQAGDLPGVQRGHRLGREEQHVVAREAGGIGQGLAILDDRAAAADPVSVLRPGSPLPPARDPKAAVDARRHAVRREDPGGQAARTRQDFPRGRIGQPPERQAGRGADEGYPAAGRITLGQGFVDPGRNARRDLQAADMLAHKHPVEAGLAHLRGDIVGKTPGRLDLGAPGRKRRGERDGRFDQGVVRVRHDHSVRFEPGCEVRSI